MARRRRKDPAMEIIPALAALTFLGVMFSPKFRSTLLLLGIVVGILLVVFVIYRIATRKRMSVVLDSQPDSFPMPGISLGTIDLPRPEPAEKTLSEKLRSLDWFQFEKLVGAAYAAQGYKVQRLGGAQPDGGVDLIIERGDEKAVVQCKQWKSWTVGVRNIREFLGTLTDAQIPKGIFITLQGYTGDARELAAKHGIQLMDENGLLQLLDSVDWKFNPVISSALDDHRKFCPKCESEMVLRTASKGFNAGNQFWGCSKYPRCRFILEA